MSPRLIVYSGLPGAGKSTQALQTANESSAVLLCRDELRKSLRNLHCENTLSSLMTLLAKGALEQGYDVVVDAWNLEKSDYFTWAEVARQQGAVLLWKFVDTPLEECIRRDSTRPDPNGETQIREVAKKYGVGLDLEY